MKRAVLVILAAALLGVAAAAVQPPDESNLPESETRIPAGHHCLAGPPAANDPKGHECACKFSCSVDANGHVSDHEDVACLSYCHKNKRVCVCHADEPCFGATAGNARMDMAGHVVAVARRAH